MTQIRVALVEDHDLTRMGLRVALQQQGINFLGEASTGAQGMKLIQSTQPDVAIIDIGLPDMDGIELTRQLKESLPDQEPGTRILILTMHDAAEAVLAAFAAGADSYCMKDVKSELLILAVQETAQGNSWIDPAVAGIVLEQMKNPAATTAHRPVSVAAPGTESEFSEEKPTLELEMHPLTDRELEVLEMIVAGHSNALIAEKLYITIGTVKTHVRSILNKLSVDDRTQAAVQALRSGLIQL